MAIFKKSNGHIFGVQFSAKEQKAVDAEILRQCSEMNRKNMNEVDACILWLLHEKFGFGYQRLKQFHKLFGEELEALTKRYEMGAEDTIWLATRKLKEYGVDIEEWNKEENQHGLQT